MAYKTQLSFLKLVKIAYKPQIYAGAKLTLEFCRQPTMQAFLVGEIWTRVNEDGKALA